MRYAIIDIGSNTIRMNIYHIENEKMKEIFSKKTVAGLSSYMEGKVLGARGIKKLVKTLASYKRMAELMQVEQILPFATASLRNAKNSAEILGKITTDTGLSLDLIDGEQEALYGYLGLTLNTDVEKTGILFDTGGGSTEVIRFADHKVTHAISVPLGSLNTFSLDMKGMTPTESEMQAIKGQMHAALDHAGVPRDKVYPIMYGIGGTARACGNVCQDYFHLDSNKIIPVEKMRALLRHVTTGDITALRTLLQIVPERVHTLSPGILLMDALAERFSVDEIRVGKKGVRDGYMLHYAQTNGLIPK